MKLLYFILPLILLFSACADKSPEYVKQGREQVKNTLANPKTYRELNLKTAALSKGEYLKNLIKADSSLYKAESELLTASLDMVTNEVKLMGVGKKIDKGLNSLIESQKKEINKYTKIHDSTGVRLTAMNNLLAKTDTNALAVVTMQFTYTSVNTSGGVDTSTTYVQYQPNAEKDKQFILHKVFGKVK